MGLAVTHVASTGIGGRTLALLVGAACVWAGWHFKLMHRAWQDLRAARATIARVRRLRRRHTFRAFLFAVGLAAILFVLLR
jgi:hypothetical protein